MVIGSEGKWSEALKDAFIQASPAGLVKTLPPGLNRAGPGAVVGVVARPPPGPAIPGLTRDGMVVNQKVATQLLSVIEKPVRSDTA
jgi:hypothetical protein